MPENLLARSAAPRHHVSPALTQTQSVTESAPMKNEARSSSLYVEARTLQQVPAKGSPNKQLELPSANLPASLAFDRDPLRATSRVPLRDDNGIDGYSSVRIVVAPERPGKVRN